MLKNNFVRVFGCIEEFKTQCYIVTSATFSWLDLFGAPDLYICSRISDRILFEERVLPTRHLQSKSGAREGGRGYGNVHWQDRISFSDAV